MLKRTPELWVEIVGRIKEILQSKPVAIFRGGLLIYLVVKCGRLLLTNTKIPMELLHRLLTSEW